MFAQHHLILLALALTIAVAGVSATDFITGSRQDNDRIICYGNFYVPGKSGVVVEQTVGCEIPSYMIITMIIAKDLDATGMGGFARIIQGGLGQNFLILYFWSQPGQDIVFTVNIYAKSIYGVERNDDQQLFNLTLIK